MKTWNAPSLEELNVLATNGGDQNGTEGNGKGNKWNGGAKDQDPAAGSNNV